MTMPARPEDLDALIDAACRLLEIPLEPDWPAAIRFNLDVTLKHGADVQAFPLPDEAEPAFVFEV
jgi:hypothetical protein